MDILVHNNIFYIVIAYMLGNISPSIILGKYILKIDIRDYGSGNAGSTNAVRVMGKKIGIAVFLIDMLKGLIPTLIAYKLIGLEFAYLIGIAVVIGHIFPILLKFRGGKGVATSFGCAIAINPLYAFISILFFLLIVSLTKYVSAASIISTAIFATLITVVNKISYQSLCSFIFFLLVIYAHRKNVSDLLKGNETTIKTK